MSVTPRVCWFRGGDADLVAAVWVARTGPAQFHAGIYHRDHGAARVLHFAWDRRLFDDAPEALLDGREHGLIVLPLDEDDARTLCALCRQVARRHGRTLRYRFAEWQPRFDPATAEMNPPPADERYGFTCATFVLAVLRSAILEEVLVLEQWPRPELQDSDDQWQRIIAKKLCSGAASPEEVAGVLAGIGARRVLPTDVAGGAMCSRERWPVGFVDARREGDKIADCLHV
ncbi:MAG: hypothetical protein U0359_36835 [Byssovorax sp.]